MVTTGMKSSSQTGATLHQNGSRKAEREGNDGTKTGEIEEVKMTGDAGMNLMKAEEGTGMTQNRQRSGMTGDQTATGGVAGATLTEDMTQTTEGEEGGTLGVASGAGGVVAMSPTKEMDGGGASMMPLTGGEAEEATVLVTGTVLTVTLTGMAT